MFHSRYISYNICREAKVLTWNTRYESKYKLLGLCTHEVKFVELKTVWEFNPTQLKLPNPASGLKLLRTHFLQYLSWDQGFPLHTHTYNIY